MSDASSVDIILSQAGERGKSYDWPGSVELYRTALSKISDQDILKKGEIHEQIGHGFFRAAGQADSVEEFKNRMQRSIKSYEKAAELLEKVEPARGLYCEAMTKYSESWLANGSLRKKELLEYCCKSMEEALETFDGADDHSGYLKAFHGLSFCLWDAYTIEDHWRERKRIAQEVLKYGQKAVAKRPQAVDEDALAWAFTMSSLFMILALDLFDERRAEFVSTISNYLEKALVLSEKIEDAYLHVFLYFTLAQAGLFVTGDLHAASKYAEKLLHQSKKANDHFLLGMAYFMLNLVTETAATTEEDPDKQRKKHKIARRFAEESVRHSLLVCRYLEVSWAYSYFLIESFLRLAEMETSFEAKYALLKDAVRVGREGSEYAQLSGSPELVCSVFHYLSKAVFFLSEIETSAKEKKELLEEALELREETIRISNLLHPPYGWNRGVFQNYLALIKADLAEVEKSLVKKKRLLEDAASSMEKCLEICTRYLQTVTVAPLPRDFAVLGWFHDWFGGILHQLYTLTKDDSVINKTIEVYQDAAQTYQKAGMPSRVAEAYWKAARLYDQRGEYIEAADNFEQASKNYRLVAGKIPQLKDFCQGQALYMQAWSEIEKSRRHHTIQEYGLAKEHYEKAADLHKSLKQWSYLASNYSAWAHVENAEDLSRREQSEEAIQAFEEAAKLFTETKESLQTELNKIENMDERQMVTSMVKATDFRNQYCAGRIALEQAKILDKKGDHYSSSEKYGSAVGVFEKVTQALESEQDRNELRLILILSKAWQKMTRAEAEASPALYKEASQLFEQAKELSQSEKAKMLALGHSRFCRALEAGTSFTDTRDTTLYTTAMQHLESAANYYMRAGFQNASEYAKATGLLFDAYLHIDSAKKEKDPERKAKLYTMAEKVLQTSAGSFMKAEHPEKREQVLRLLEKVKEEQELAISLSEVLHAPSIASATTLFTTPTPTHETAVGLERFEHADVQANLITRRKELKVGENLDLEIELVNAGKGPALLTKITEIIPEGFELTEKPQNYRVEDSCLNMKGKRLDSLKTEEMKLVLRPKVRGVFPLRPRILYLDENGKYKIHEPEPITITVKELGVKGWIKGER